MLKYLREKSVQLLDSKMFIELKRSLANCNIINMHDLQRE
jgi:hypothetical protein